MKRLSSSLLLSLFVAVGLLVAGCDSTGADGESGTLELRMAGSSSQTTSLATTNQVTSSDIEEALVTIDEVAIVPTDDSSDGDSTEVGVQTLTDENFEVDLKRLQAGVDTFMSEVEIPADSYSQLRFVTDGDAEVLFTDGEQRSVRIASGPQTGVKINFDSFTVDSADDRVELTINWDVEESLQGNERAQFVITPVVDATATVTSAGSEDDNS